MEPADQRKEEVELDVTNDGAGRPLTMVFGSNVAGLHREANAAFAVRHFGAEEGRWNGPTGASFAIPYRSSRLELLPVDVIERYTKLFLAHAQAASDTDFRVARFGSGPGQHPDEAMAGLFHAAPANVALCGLWQGALDPARGPRIIVSDPTDALRAQDAQRGMRRLLEERIAAAGRGEIVSIDGVSNLRIDEALADVLAFDHRVVRPDLGRYGAHAPMAGEVEAVWRSTHLVGVTTSLRRTQPMQARLVALASREGLEISHLSL